MKKDRDIDFAFNTFSKQEINHGYTKTLVHFLGVGRNKREIFMMARDCLSLA